MENHIKNIMSKQKCISVNSLFVRTSHLVKSQIQRNRAFRFFLRRSKFAEEGNREWQLSEAQHQDAGKQAYCLMFVRTVANLFQNNVFPFYFFCPFRFLFYFVAFIFTDFFLLLLFHPDRGPNYWLAWIYCFNHLGICLWLLPFFFCCNSVRSNSSDVCNSG